MAQVKVHGEAQPFEAFGRDIFLKNLDKGGAISQANLDVLVDEVSLTCTISAIGAFTAGASTEVNMIIEGADLANGNATITGYTISDISF